MTKIKLLAFDLDGVLTNGNILLDGNGNWLRQMNIKDGFALQLAVKKGFHVAVVTGSNSAEVENRLSKLNIVHYFQNVKDKSICLNNLKKELSLSDQQVMFMGDDIPDLQAFSAAGFKTCPSDASSEIIQSADFISTQKGGEGCVREVVEMIMKAQDLWNDFHETSSI